MTELVPCYIAHRLGAGVPQRELNRRDAMDWACWLAERYLIEPVCPWIVLAEGWPESKRDLGLEIDRAALERVGLLIACGPTVSPGMAIEMTWARTIVYLTGLDGECAADVPEIDRRMALSGIRRRDG